MEDSVSQKIFPKELREETLENVNCYPAYRRRDNGTTVRVCVYVADNRFVVPYNRYLLRNYKGHINLEACCRGRKGSLNFTSLLIIFLSFP